MLSNVNSLRNTSKAVPERDTGAASASMDLLFAAASEAHVYLAA